MIMVSNPKKTKSLLDTVLFLDAKQKLDESETLSQRDNPDLQFTPEHPSTRAPGQVPEQVPKHPGEHQGTRAPERLAKRAPGRAPEHLSTRTPEHPALNTFNKNDMDSIPNKPHNLNDKQLSILKYVYFNRPFKVKGDNGIGNILGLKYNTVRNSLKSLEAKGYIEKPFFVNDGVYNGSNCRVNTDLCMALFGPPTITQPIPNQIEHPGTRVPERAPEHPNTWASEHPSTRTPASYSSSSFFKKTTTEAPLDLSDPYLMFWVEKGLTSKKIQLWMNEFNLSSSLLLDFLKWAKFDLVDNDKAKSVKQDDFQAWFYGALKKGGYSKPANYKSHHQILIEQETQELERMKTELKTLNELRKEKRRLTLEIEFERMMADPEGDLYKRCFELFPSIQKTRYRNPSKQVGPSFEKEMKWSLEKIMHGDLNGTDTDSDQ